MGNPPERGVYEFDDFRLDAGHLMLYRQGEEVEIQPKAVETLLALVERRGDVVSKDELLEAVWPDAIVEESNLFLYLSILRKTLGVQKSGKPWVQTLRRRGYRFNGDVRLVPATNGKPGTPPAEAVPLHLIPPTVPQNHEAQQTEPGKTHTTLRRTAFAASGLLAVVAALAFTYWYFIAQREIDSIAVMPFVNESGDAELNYLSDAMTETLIGSLSKIHGMEVKSSASVSRYKGNNADSRTIGKDLNAQAVLYGHIAQRGDDVSLRIELVDARTENRLWDRTYTRKISNLRALETEVSRDLAGRLRERLLGSSEEQVARSQPENSEAYQLFLRGRFHYRKLTRTEIEKGISYFEQAIEIDPSYALAYAAKAEAYRALVLAADMPPGENFSKARAAAQKAFEIDPNLAEANAGLAAVTYLYDWNFADAENKFLRALELDPDSSMSHLGYGDFLFRRGRFDESLAHIRRARELEPLSPFLNAFEAVGYIGSDKDEALRRVNVAIDLAPDFYFAHLMAGNIYRAKQMDGEAIASFRLAKQLAPDQTWSDVALAGALARTGQAEEARTILDEMLRRSQSGYVSPYHIAVVYKQLGDTEQAFQWLEKGYEQRDPKMTFLQSEPRWRQLREHPRFKELLRRIGFPPDPA